MAGIAGVAQMGAQAQVEQMLKAMAHRGNKGRTVFECEAGVLGAVGLVSQPDSGKDRPAEVQDAAGAGRLARAYSNGGRLMLMRDPLGVAPLYYGYTSMGALCFASEVKGLQEITQDVNELPPGHSYSSTGPEPFFRLQRDSILAEHPDDIACELRRRLASAVEESFGQEDTVGAWLSGGLDSSTIAALARPLAQQLHTVVAGLPGAPDLDHARMVADHIGATHHERLTSFAEMLSVLPKVIYHLESFDALLVRSSITNYLAAELLSGYVPTALSGEGGDELFAGYAYLKQLDRGLLPDELMDITLRLHNTALQRVDRCASAHGMVAHVVFLAPQVVEYALRIPTIYKLHHRVEKWILRLAVADLLPGVVLNRTKAKFWEGAGVGELLADYADKHVSNADYRSERLLKNGWVINSKEEMLYYRIFRETFGDIENLDWMGRTKGAPTQQTT